MRQGLKWQITWARMPRLSKQYLPSLCDMCINEQGKTFKSVWDKGPVPSPQKKRKKKIRLYGNWRKWSLYMSSARQGRADPGPREYVVRSVFFTKGFETETLFLTEWVIGKKKEWEGRRKRKCFLHVPSPQPNLSKPKSNMVAQWIILSSLMRCLYWKKVFGVFVKGPSPHKKRQLNIFVSVRQ